MDKKYVITFYIAGVAPDTQDMIVDLKDHLSSTLGHDQFILKVVDVLDKPHLAEEEQILATPTIVKKEPTPSKKIILNPNNKKTIHNLDKIFKEKDK